jgi:hypothetical protein
MRLLARRPDGIFVAPFEQGEIGPDLNNPDYSVVFIELLVNVS